MIGHFCSSRRRSGMEVPAGQVRAKIIQSALNESSQGEIMNWTTIAILS
jgi:hypothetical protein